MSQDNKVFIQFWHMTEFRQCSLSFVCSLDVNCPDANWLVTGFSVLLLIGAYDKNTSLCGCVQWKLESRVKWCWVSSSQVMLGVIWTVGGLEHDAWILFCNGYRFWSLFTWLKLLRHHSDLRFLNISWTYFCFRLWPVGLLHRIGPVKGPSLCH